MDSDKIKKIAELLRQHADKLEEKKQTKVANIALAAASLELLRRKINGQ